MLKGKLTLEQAKKMMEKKEGSLDLRGTGITALPEGLTVGGSLDLEGCTGITALPEGLTVVGWLDLEGTGITGKRTARKLKEGEYVEGRYLFADGILTHVKKARKISGYTFFEGKIKGKNVLFDGENYVHCKTIMQGVADLNFKKQKERGASQYKDLTLDSIVSRQDAIVMYRIITGACSMGTQAFLDEQRELKEKYTVREIVEMTKGRYGHATFAAFFAK